MRRVEWIRAGIKCHQIWLCVATGVGSPSPECCGGGAVRGDRRRWHFVTVGSSFAPICPAVIWDLCRSADRWPALARLSLRSVAFRRRRFVLESARCVASTCHLHTSSPANQHGSGVGGFLQSWDFKQHRDTKHRLGLILVQKPPVEPHKQKASGKLPKCRCFWFKMRQFTQFLTDSNPI